jgi:hypothetical protein
MCSFSGLSLILLSTWPLNPFPHSNLNHDQALWIRAPFGVSPTTAYQELFHSTLDAAVRPRVRIERSMKMFATRCVRFMPSMDRNLTVKPRKAPRTSDLGKRCCYKEEQIWLSNYAIGPIFGRHVMRFKISFVFKTFFTPFFFRASQIGGGSSDF